ESTKDTLKATKAEGGVSVDDQFTDVTPQELFNAILAPYVAPVLSSIVITNGSSVEVGAVVSITNAKLSWVNDSEGNPPQNMAISNSGFPSVALVASPQNVAATAGTTVQRTTAGSEQWSFTAKDKNAVALPYKYDRVYWYFKRYWGASASESLTDAEIIALGSEFGSSRAMTKTIDASGGKYPFFAYPASWGEATFKVGGLAFSSVTKVTRPFKNASLHTESYHIYRFNDLQTGAAINVEIS
ncbi:MAG: hypothetical protein PF444_00495, partial [Bacteroidales bacterium]|nr:hypothetical protein [Bacteroidales bacterium]